MTTWNARVALFQNFVYSSRSLSDDEHSIIKLTTDLELVQLIPSKEGLQIVDMKIASTGIACMRIVNGGIVNGLHHYGCFDVRKEFSLLWKVNAMCHGISLWSDEFYLTLDRKNQKVITLECDTNTGELKQSSRMPPDFQRSTRVFEFDFGKL
jgi:hypothetical protein